MKRTTFDRISKVYSIVLSISFVVAVIWMIHGVWGIHERRETTCYPHSAKTSFKNGGVWYVVCDNMEIRKEISLDAERQEDFK